MVDTSRSGTEGPAARTTFVRCGRILAHLEAVRGERPRTSLPTLRAPHSAPDTRAAAGDCPRVATASGPLHRPLHDRGIGWAPSSTNEIGVARWP